MTPQTVVASGASAGIGRAVARAFAARGATVGLIARGEEEAGASAVWVNVAFTSVFAPFPRVNLFSPADGEHGHDFGMDGVFGHRTISRDPQLWASSRHHGALAAAGAAAVAGAGGWLRSPR